VNLSRAKLSLLLALGIGLVAFGARDALWRAAYPHLPRQLQAAPYRIGALFSPSTTPVPLPTAAAPLPAPASPPPPDPVETAAELDPAAGALGTASAGSGRTDEPAGQPAADRDSPTPPADAAGATPVAAPALPAAALLPEIAHQYQTWNNCGPATVAMALGVLDLEVGQAEAAQFLKPDPNDKNVSPDELAAFARQRGFEARVLIGGTVDELRGLLAAGVPVIAEVWFVPEPGDEMGHYVLLAGYSDAERTFLARDSYRGPNVHLPYDGFDADWRAFNRTAVVVFAAAQRPAVQAVVGSQMDDPAALARRALAAATQEAEARGDAFAWFNLGSSLTLLGDFQAAADAYDRARAVGLPWRMLWYQFGPFEAYAAVGRWADVEALAGATLANAPNLEESRLWLGRSRRATGDLAGAREQFELALHYNPNFAPARRELEP
jgi:tetratricopeptide (TPR) repeat protein